MKFLTLFFTLSLLAASTAGSIKSATSGYFSLPDKSKIFVSRILTTPMQKQMGLSGVKVNEFSENEGAFFWFDRVGMRNFWMPDTYFNLDIIYLDRDFKIIALEKNVKHHPSRKGKIPTARPQIAQHVLEIKSGTELSKKIKVGMKLIWKSQPL